MSSPERTLAILGLFSGERPIWQPDAINAALGYSRPTGYRYVKALVAAGLLHRLEPGLYCLGPRIIELDYQLRQSQLEIHQLFRLHLQSLSFLMRYKDCLMPL